MKIQKMPRLSDKRLWRINALGRSGRTWARQRIMMNEQGIRIQKLPRLSKPILIAGFDGWGNALDVSNTMVEYLIRKLQAESFASLDPDMFYRYDEARPLLDVVKGEMKSYMPPGGGFHAAHPKGNDLVIMKANEPQLRWFRFADEFFALCKKLDVETVITLGSMYDNVLHSDRLISGIASDEALFSRLKEERVTPISYQGPAAIHAIIQSEGQKKGFRCVSLWGHCPFYLEGIVHFGVLSALARLLRTLFGFELDVGELDTAWEELNEKIYKLVEENPDLQEVVREIRKSKMKGSLKQTAKSEKVINLKDFLESR